MLEQKPLRNLIVIKFLTQKGSKEKPKWQWANHIEPSVLDRGGLYYTYYWYYRNGRKQTRH